LPPAGSDMEQKESTSFYEGKDGRTIGSGYIGSIAKKGSTYAVNDRAEIERRLIGWNDQG